MANVTVGNTHTLLKKKKPLFLTPTVYIKGKNTKNKQAKKVKKESDRNCK